MPWDIWLIFLLLGVFLPWRGRIRLRELLAKPEVTSAERLSLYRSTIAFQWCAAGIAAWRAWARGFAPQQLGLVFERRALLVAVAILGGALLSALHWVNLRRMGRTGSKTRESIQRMAERILPRSRQEVATFLVLAVTAGLCEEFMYRGFAMAALSRAGLPTWMVILVSSILFGLAHLYQGRGGLVGTLLLGAVFGGLRVAGGSLIPPMVWHAMIDIVAGIAGPKFLLGRQLTVYKSEP
jgi:membrane protease YdiL (CAAX protease family)